MKNFSIFLIIFLALIVFYLLYDRSKNTCYKLPTDHDPRVFGPAYWKLLHTTVEKIPCPSCRDEGVEMMIFLHDTVNYKIRHQKDFSEIFDKENFEKWLQKVCDIKQEYEKNYNN